MGKLSDYQSSGDAIGLAKIGGDSFTIIQVEDSQYDGQPSLIICTQKPIKVDGKEYSRFYTSRKAVMDTLKNEQLRADLKEGKTVGPVKCVKVEAKGNGKPYWILVEA